MQTSDPQHLEAFAQYRWNRLTWFGAVAGGATWMLCTGVFVMANAEMFAGLSSLTSGLFTLVVGTALWRMRNRLSIETAMIVLLVSTLLTVTIAILCTTRLTSTDLLARMNWPNNPIPLIVGLNLVLGAGICLNCSRLFRKYRRQNTG